MRYYRKTMNTQEIFKTMFTVIKCIANIESNYFSDVIFDFVAIFS